MPEHRRMKRMVLLLGLAALGAAILAACGSSGGSPAASTPTPATTASQPASTATSTTDPTTATTTTTAPTTTTASATTNTTTTSASSGAPPCRASALSLSFIGQQGGMGHGEIGFALKNISSMSCRTYGYPGILFLDQSGHPLTTIPHHTTSDFFGSSAAVPLVIPPGGSASFRLDVGHGVATSAGCDTAYGLQVIPPDDTATLHTAIPNGAYECHDANVSPLRAGASAYP
jgi:ABC-type transport system substrate-binding protein